MRSETSNLRRAGLAFVAGFLSVLVFHQGGWAILNSLHVVPTAAWSLAPVPPIGVPTVISQAFWGGVWAVLLVFALPDSEGAAYVASWVVSGAIILTLVALFVVAPLKGAAITGFPWARFGIGALVNGLWGLGTALFLWITAAAGQPRRAR